MSEEFFPIRIPCLRLNTLGEIQFFVVLTRDLSRLKWKTLESYRRHLPDNSLGERLGTGSGVISRILYGPVRP